MASDPILSNPDFNKKFLIETDTCDFALGAVLSQRIEYGNKHPIANTSRTLNGTECRYSAIKKELFGVLFVIKLFRPYVYRTKFGIRTGSKPIIWLREKNDLNSKLLRWKLQLKEFEFDFTYKKGTLNGNADSLSRITEQNKDIEEINHNSTSNNMTQHSADTDDNNFMKSTERPLNKF